MPANFSIRAVTNTTADIQHLTQFMRELAQSDGYDISFSADKLQQQLFYPGTNVRAYFATLDEQPIGFTLFYESFTVYHGERGIYVPGVYIAADYRGRGYGKALFAHIANYASKNGMRYMNWLVAGDNHQAQKLYTQLGAELHKGWVYVRVSEKTMQKLAQK